MRRRNLTDKQRIALLEDAIDNFAILEHWENGIFFRHENHGALHKTLRGVIDQWLKDEEEAAPARHRLERWIAEQRKRAEGRRNCA